jgi:galactose mutarotase-like enzyme
MEQVVRETCWSGRPALQLENDRLRVVVVPGVGAKIVSLFDKRQQLEWLVGHGDKPFRAVRYGASFTGQDMSGWDEMFPTISACDYPGPGSYHGVPLPDHGEVWALPWSVLESAPAQIVLAVEGQTLPYRLVRTLAIPSPDTVQLSYELTNDGPEDLSYLWAAHPQFQCGEGLEIVLPAEVRRVRNSLPPEWGWGAPETEYDWPEAVDAHSRSVRLDRVGKPALRRARKFFALPDVAIDHVTLVQPGGAWLDMRWSPAGAPYFGVWIDEGALSHSSIVAPEPMTGFYDSLAVAWNNDRVSAIAPGATQSWIVRVQLGSP